jgi:hypothetical protein
MNQNPLKALTFLQRARGTSENLLEKDSNNDETIADLALIYGNTGVASAAIGDFDKSIFYREKSLEFFKRCLPKNSRDDELKCNFLEIEKQNEQISAQTTKLQPNK